jgi:cytoskeleton protein RodZ
MPGKETSDFGATLRAAREAREISLRQISDVTNISMSILLALENNDTTRLPGGIFTRSFIRSYAVEVGLDPVETVREFLEQSSTTRGEDRLTIANDAKEHALFRSDQRMAKTIFRLILISVLVALVLFLLNWTTGDRRSFGESDEVEALAERRVTTAPEAIPLPVVAPATEVPAVSNLAVGAPLSIDIHPTKNCWVSVTLDGERAFSRVMQAGEREVVEAEREIIINVGDAGAFDFEINQLKGRDLGANGEVVTARINRENYLNFIKP